MYLELVDCHPGIGRESLEHGHKELEASGPVSDEQHHTDEVEDSHKDARHIEELIRRKKKKQKKNNNTNQMNMKT